jgi:arginyl-tRNA synthetase
MLGEDMKKLSTRAGKHISLGEVLDEAVVRAKTVVDEKRKDLSERERRKIAETIGIAAVKYNDLSQNRQSDIAFQWDKMLNFEGNSAPYLLYSYARMRSILRKGGRVFSLGRNLSLVSEHDRGLFLKLVQLPHVLKCVEETFFPNLLTDYLYDLARATNAFYEQEQVLKSEPAARHSRLALVKAVADALKTGLGLLGIRALERM